MDAQLPVVGAADEAIAPLREHTVVRVRGENPLAFLDATTSQALDACAPGSGALTCLLDDKGRVLAEFRVLPLADGSVLCDGEAATREALTGWLARVAPLSGCEVVDESGEWNATAFRNVAAPGDEHSFREENGTITVATRWGGEGYDVLARTNGAAFTPPAAAATDASGGGGRGVESVERVRIAGGRVRFGIDVTPAMILNETPLIDHAVSFTKGCYPGQETVAKIRNLGRPRRAFVILESDGDAIPLEEPVTSTAGGVALAFVRVEDAERETIDVGGVTARVRRIG